ncbi:hypothetical protein DFA_11263 [Cavenderia fasciculata]|uniref:EGF-like domain-containing protein n=1 Tax=Cavenderia fasciculata TaxID=261658 RepID=F4QFP9_CACFS|nr:uncharacterized protein DFA_11263 [Cavenderia fasciculata]EGG13502.1 hypothetical protein DFA_11263 [Cavenderia fasciculata]|eukprot:XP_004350206.1 hypothetical protein DFA_11263 [Cavenderia fasciculata]
MHFIIIVQNVCNDRIQLSVQEYNSSNNKNVELNGDFGPSISNTSTTTTTVSIKINNTIECVVESVSQFHFNCTLDQQPSFGLASVQLKLNNHLNTLARNILNLQITTNHNNHLMMEYQNQNVSSNTFNCYGHGYCDDSGKCQCQNGYSDIDNCLTKYINRTITPNTTDPTVSFDVDGLDFDFLFEIDSFQELDLDDKVAESNWKIIVIAVCVSFVVISIILIAAKVLKKKVQFKFANRFNKCFKSQSNKMSPIAKANTQEQ